MGGFRKFPENFQLYSNERQRTKTSFGVKKFAEVFLRLFDIFKKQTKITVKCNFGTLRFLEKNFVRGRCSPFFSTHRPPLYYGFSIITRWNLVQFSRNPQCSENCWSLVILCSSRINSQKLYSFMSILL